MEFCKCGSVMNNGSCTNKNCSNKLAKVSSAKSKKAGVNKAAAGGIAVVKTVAKTTKVPRASKCITYHISELDQREEQK